MLLAHFTQSLTTRLFKEGQMKHQIVGYQQSSPGWMLVSAFPSFYPLGLTSSSLFNRRQNRPLYGLRDSPFVVR